MKAAGQQNRFSVFTNAQCHETGFCKSRGAVVHRGIGDLHAEEFTDHRLKFKNDLKSPLRNFWLIGGIGSQKFGASDQFSHSRRNIVSVNTSAQKRTASGEWVIFSRDLFEMTKECHFIQSRRKF